MIGFAEITFEEIKDIANEVSSACINGNFDEVYTEKVSKRRELTPADVTAICKLGDLYIQTKRGLKSREDTATEQKTIKEEWENELH